MKYLLFTGYLLIQGIATLSAQDFSLLERELDSSKILNGHFFGFVLYDLQENCTVVKRNEDKYFTPASNSKIYALYTTLKTLGDSIPGLAYKVQNDSLYFWGTGDPTFLHPKYCSGKVLKFLQDSPYTLVYCPSTVDVDYYRPGWMIEDYIYDYQSELSTFPIYGNTVRFVVNKSGVSTIPAYFMQALRLNPAIRNRSVVRRIDENIFEIKKDHSDNPFRTTVPFKYSQALFVTLLEQSISKPILTSNKQTPADANILYSNSTQRILREMMVYSDNFLAEQMAYVSSFSQNHSFLLINLRKDRYNRFWSLLTDKINLEDESGLSFYNKVTPRSNVEVLLAIDKLLGNSHSRNHLFAAGGIDGTIARTYKADMGMPFIWAKTGTLQAVYNQSGYIKGKSGKEYIFSFLNNNFIQKASLIRREVSRIMTLVHDHY